MNRDLPIFHWRLRPEVRTTPLVCIFGCDVERNPVTAVIFAPHGCRCHANKYQPRCYHHVMRAYDSEEEFEIVEDFIIGEAA